MKFSEKNKFDLDQKLFCYIGRDKNFLGEDKDDIRVIGLDKQTSECVRTIGLYECKQMRRS